MYWPEGLEQRDPGKPGALTKLDKKIIKGDPPRFLARIPASEVNEIMDGVALLRSAVKKHAAHEFYDNHEQFVDYPERRRQQLALEALQSIGDSTVQIADECRKIPPMKLDFYQW